MIVEAQRDDRPLMLLLDWHVKQARKQKLRPFLMFSADWCKPCVTFKQHTKTGSIADALEGTYLVILDYDAWQKEAESIGVSGIPTWLDLSEKDRRLDSSQWKDPDPGAIAEAIRPFFSR